MSAVPHPSAVEPLTFAKHAELVMLQRNADGIRGIDRERSRFKCHILTADFASMPIDTITHREVRAWLRVMAEKETLTRRLDEAGPRTLSWQTVNRCKSLVSAVFIDAVERDILDADPSAGVKIKRRLTEHDTRQKWAYLLPSEQDAFRACSAIPYADRLAVAFAAHTGLRQSEQRYLELGDLVVAGADPHVVVRIAGEKHGKKLPPKSGKRRVVPLLPPALDAAVAWLAQLDDFAPSNPLGLVFPNAFGRRRSQGKPLGRGETLKLHYKAAGITLRPHLHWHALRHTYASNLVTGVYGRRWSMEEIRIVMGHSSVAITERYAHLGEDAIRRAARETVEAAPKKTVVQVPVAIEPAPAPIAPPAPELDEKPDALVPLPPRSARPGLAKTVWRAALAALMARAS